jgi:hypothetical protein
VCPAASLAASCYTGVDGTAGAGVLSWIGTMLSLTQTDLTPVSGATAAGTATACVSATATCDAMLALDPSSSLTAAMCPSGQSVTVHVAAPLNEDPTVAGSCMGAVHVLNTLGFRAVSACGTSDCNAPATVIYVPSVATLLGYTVNTFLAAEVAIFIAAMASSLNVAASYVVVTGVTASASASASGRHLLQAGVDVGFTVQSTVASAAAVHSALATPPTAAALVSAGLTAVTSVAVAPQPAASVTAAPPVSAAALAANAVAPPTPSVAANAAPAAGNATTAAASAAPARCALAAAALAAPALLAALA